MALRLQSMGHPRYARGFEVTVQKDLLDAPRRWRKPRLVFVNSMSDLFHELVPLEIIQRIFAAMNACPQHTFQALTKRSGRLREIAGMVHWTPNIRMGVSVENRRAITRIDDLRSVPGACSIPFVGAAARTSRRSPARRHPLGDRRRRIRTRRPPHGRRPGARDPRPMRRAQHCILLMGRGAQRKSRTGAGRTNL